MMNIFFLEFWKLDIFVENFDRQLYIKKLHKNSLVMCILLVKNQGCFHPSKIVKAKIIKIFIITPQKNNTLTTIVYCRIARKNLILRLWKLFTTLCHSTKTKTTQKNYKFWGEHDVNIKEQKTLMLSLYERFSCQFSEIKEWYTYWNGIVSLLNLRYSLQTFKFLACRKRNMFQGQD